MAPSTYLIDVFRRILLQVHRPPDLQIGLTIQVGGLDEAHLQRDSITTDCDGT